MPACRVPSGSEELRAKYGVLLSKKVAQQCPCEHCGDPMALLLVWIIQDQTKHNKQLGLFEMHAKAASSEKQLQGPYQAAEHATHLWIRRGCLSNWSNSAPRAVSFCSTIVSALLDCRAWSSCRLVETFTLLAAARQRCLMTADDNSSTRRSVARPLSAPCSVSCHIAIIHKPVRVGARERSETLLVSLGMPRCDS